VDVVLLVDERELDSFKSILDEMADWELEKYLGDGETQKIHLIPARFNTKWIRDYGPIFVSGKQGGIYLTDAVYRDVREEAGLSDRFEQFSFDGYLKSAIVKVFGETPLNETDTTDRHEDDSAAMYLASYLQQRHGINIETIRVPFQLWGGDVLTGGEGDIFLSTETLFMNGGRRDDLELILRCYYGMKNVTYLSPLPGETIKHLDMIFKPVDANTMLAAEYPADVKDSDAYMQYLHDETLRMMDRNAKILHQKFPGRRLARMPMPPLKRISKLPAFGLSLTKNLFESKNYEIPKELIDSPEQWTFDKFLYFMNAFMALFNSQDNNEPTDLLGILDVDDPKKYADEDEALLTHLVRMLIANDPKLLDWIAKPYRESAEKGAKAKTTIEQALKKLTKEFVPDDLYANPATYTYIYRTYLNSTYLNGPSGKMLLVPSYEGCEEMEQQVREIYKELYPGAEIVFIESDGIIDQYGAIHCLTVTMPAFHGNEAESRKP